MHRPQWIKVSLARKICLLFGMAVLLTIIATLSFPWLHMEALNEHAVLLEAKLVAQAARQSVHLGGSGGTWLGAQFQLDQRWPRLARELDLPADPPSLVSVELVRQVADAVAKALDTHLSPQATTELVQDLDKGFDLLRHGGVDQEILGQIERDRMRIMPLLVAGGFRGEAFQEFHLNPDRTYYWSKQDDGRSFRLALAVRGSDTDPHPDALRGIIDVKLPIPRAPTVWSSAITVLAGASGAVLAILVFYLVTQRLVLSKVNALRQVAERVATGDMQVRSRISSGDEFEELSTAFNDMLSHLRAAQDDLRTINRSLDVKLGELSEANKALYEANRLKSDFLSNVTHELRTPLVSIIGFAELLHDAWEHPNTDRSRMLRFAENILVSGRSLLEIINDLLDLAKIEAGRMELHIIEFSLAELCGDLIDFVRPLADKRNQSLSLAVEPELPAFCSDSGKIKQILYNLLSNAIKFTPTGGAVSLTVRPDGDSRVRMTISDTGPGIPQDRREVIFEKFQQLDSSRTREHEGTGLGLAITRDLVELLGGRIFLEQEPKEGSHFTVILPTAIEERQPKTSLRSVVARRGGSSD